MPMQIFSYARLLDYQEANLGPVWVKQTTSWDIVPIVKGQCH